MDANKVKTSPRKVKAAYRRGLAMELRLSGASYSKIAEAISARFGIRYSRTSAYEDVKQELNDLLEKRMENAAAMKAIEMERIGELIRVYMPLAKQGDHKAAGIILKCDERISALQGLEAPKKIAPTDPTGEHEYVGLTEDERAERLTEILQAAGTRRDRQAVTAESDMEPATWAPDGGVLQPG